LEGDVCHIVNTVLICGDDLETDVCDLGKEEDGDDDECDQEEDEDEDETRGRYPEVGHVDRKIFKGKGVSEV
jgi:hypothetical protein